MGIREWITGKWKGNGDGNGKRKAGTYYEGPDDHRPIRFVPEGENVWRVEFADGKD